MGDLLSAASLLLAVIGILYGFWYTELSDTKKTTIPQHSADCTAPRIIVSRIFWSKALPLAAASCLLGIVFLPDAVKLIFESYTLFRKQSMSLASYDAVRTAFCVVVWFKLALATHLLILCAQLYILRKQLREKENSGGQQG